MRTVSTAERVEEEELSSDCEVSADKDEGDGEIECVKDGEGLKEAERSESDSSISMVERRGRRMARKVEGSGAICTLIGKRPRATRKGGELPEVQTRANT